MITEGITLEIHKTVDDIYKKYFNPLTEGLPDEEIDFSEIIAFDEKGNMVHAASEDVTIAKEEGFWGFAQEKEGIINIWVDIKKASTEKILMLLGHEIGHIVEKRRENFSKEGMTEAELYFYEEDRADDWGHVSVLAYNFYKELITETGRNSDCT